jgi:hypothetical protein
MTIHRLHQAMVAVAVILGLVVLAPASAIAASVGQTCGGIAGIRCDAGLWCEPPTGRCGAADLQGKCVRVPTVCTAIYLPVCGCDKKTYGNNCSRLAARIQKNSAGECK